jgi:peptide/nickel transport system substrate-binding protein
MASDSGMSLLAGKRDYVSVRKALEGAGYQGEKVVLLAVSDNPIFKALADVAADALKRVGMDVDYQAMDAGTLLQRRAFRKPPAEGGWNLFCTAFAGLDFLTPASHLVLRANGNGAFFGWPDDPKIEALREAWFNAQDPAEQRKIGADIQLQAFQSVPYWPLGVARIPMAFRQDITGVLEGFPKFWNLRRI